MVRLQALKAFLLIAELKSFNKTAAQLNTTQPAISARLRGLEEVLGRRLVHRHGREVALTAAGLEVLRYARPIIELTDGLEALFRPDDRIHGTIRIGAIDTIIHTWLSPLFERLYRMHPDLTFEITADTSARLAEDLRNGDIDVALIMGPLDDDGVTSEPLCDYPMAWVVAPGRFDGRFDGRTAVDVRELADLPIISYPRGSKPYRMIETLFDDPAGLRPKLSCSNSLATIVRLACDGLGIAAIPPSIIREELARGQLQILPVTQDFPPLQCHVCHFTTARSTAPGLVAAAALEEAARWQAELALAGQGAG